MTKSSFNKKQLKCLQAYAEQRYENMRGARADRNIDFVLYILMVVVLALGVRTFLAEPIRVEGNSMVPTLLDGEHMFVEKVSYWCKQPARGDVLICFYPGYDESCVKRVIGLPGETVAVTNGVVTVDGAPLDESLYWTEQISGDTQPVTVPDKQVFVIGDNRNFSKDSRSPSVGPIPYYKVVGRVRAVIWPLSVYRTFPSVEYR